jgi:hypothetical protein
MDIYTYAGRAGREKAREQNWVRRARWKGKISRVLYTHIFLNPDEIPSHFRINSIKQYKNITLACELAMTWLSAVGERKTWYKRPRGSVTNDFHALRCCHSRFVELE